MLSLSAGSLKCFDVEKSYFIFPNQKSQERSALLSKFQSFLFASSSFFFPLLFLAPKNTLFPTSEEGERRNFTAACTVVTKVTTQNRANIFFATTFSNNSTYPQLSSTLKSQKYLSCEINSFMFLLLTTLAVTTETTAIERHTSLSLSPSFESVHSCIRRFYPNPAIPDVACPPYYYYYNTSVVVYAKALIESAAASCY